MTDQDYGEDIRMTDKDYGPLKVGEPFEIVFGQPVEHVDFKNSFNYAHLEANLAVGIEFKNVKGSSPGDILTIRPHAPPFIMQRNGKPLVVFSFAVCVTPFDENDDSEYVEIG